MDCSVDDDFWDECASPRCKVVRRYADDSSYDHPRMTGSYYCGDWFCDSCFAVLTGKQRIQDLEVEKAQWDKKRKWFESLIKPGILARVFRRFFMRRSYRDRMENALSCILNHAGVGIGCCGEPGDTTLREICEIVDDAFGISTSEEE